MTDDHEDYETGAAPAAHGPSHELAGDDEISVAGLSGETAALSAHKILPSIHHVKFTAAEARAAINNIFGSDGKADVDINLDTHKLINVVDPVTDQGGDTKKARNQAITDHTGVATAHQDAPQLILDHKGDAAAHHAKYTDAEARAVHSPISISPPAFVPYLDTHDWEIKRETLKNRATLTGQYFLPNIAFPPGVTVTKVTLYGYRDDNLSTMSLTLSRVHRLAGFVVMSLVTADWNTGWSSGYDDAIDYDVINNGIFSYNLMLYLFPNDSVDDVKLSGVKIEFTG